MKRLITFFITRYCVVMDGITNLFFLFVVSIVTKNIRRKVMNKTNILKFER